MTFAEVDGNFQSLFYSSSFDGTNLVLYTTGSTSQSIDLSTLSTSVTLDSVLTAGNIGTTDLILTTGSIGIGTTDPTGSLHIKTDSGSANILVESLTTENAQLTLRHSSTGGSGNRNSAISFQEDSTTHWTIGLNGVLGTSDDEFVIANGPQFDNNPVLVINKSGYAGFGLGVGKNPTNILELGGATTNAASLRIVTQSATPSSPENGMLRNDSGSLYFYNGTDWVGLGSPPPTYWETGSGEFSIKDVNSSSTIETAVSFSVIAGGTNHTITSGNRSGIYGGFSHSIENGASSVIVGGREGLMGGNSSNSFIGGGQNNALVSGSGASQYSRRSGIVAGANNTISGSDNAVILGGSGNTLNFSL